MAVAEQDFDLGRAAPSTAVDQAVPPAAPNQAVPPVRSIEVLADPNDPGIGKVADMFKLLGDPTRCRILYALLDAPDLPVHDIADVVGASQTTVSAALRLLRTAGVVIGRRDGRAVHYRVADDHVAKLLTVSWQHARHVTPADRAEASR